MIFNRDIINHLKKGINFKNKNSNIVKLISIAALTIAFLLFYIYENSMENAITIDDLKRPDYSEAEKELDMQVSSQGKKFNTSIRIEPRMYTAKEISAIFSEISKILEDTLLGENSSIDNITSDVVLCSSVDAYPVTIQWLSDNYEVIDENGIVHNMLFEKDKSVEVVLTAILQYESYSAEYFYELTVKSCDLDEKNYPKKISESLEFAKNSNREEAYIYLPKEIDGELITYEKKADWDRVFVILMLGIAAIIVVIFGEKSKQKKRADIRKKALKNSYSEMVAKITLLIGAGMTMRKAWEKIVEEYQLKKLHKNIKSKAVYEEMTESMNQLKSGVSELTVYQDFGNRCDVREYMKLSSLLAQNLKKGSRELLSMLKIETQDAFEERKNQAKRYGEEAGTKLLIPMIMILFVVMVIIMYPALVNFNM